MRVLSHRGCGVRSSGAGAHARPQPTAPCAAAAVWWRTAAHRRCAAAAAPAAAAAAAAAPAKEVVVLGLGPGPAALLTRQAWDMLVGSDAPVYARTLKHPTLAQLPREVQLRSFDDLYNSSATLQEVYPQISDRLLALAEEHGRVVYAVPGDPCVAELSVKLLRAAAERNGVRVRVLPGLSFLEPTLAALRIDALPSLLVVDALDVMAQPCPPAPVSTPLLLTQVYSRQARERRPAGRRRRRRSPQLALAQVASDLKLALMGAYPDDHRVALVHAAGDGGDAGETVEWLPLHDIDRSQHTGAQAHPPPLLPLHARA